MITVSVVSHGHGSMVARLARQLLESPEVSALVITLNVEEALDLPDDLRVRLIRNASPQGFAANHNAAFALCDDRYYCVVNPDIELLTNPFPALLEALSLPDAAIAAPVVLGGSGAVEDSWRRFPSPLDLVLKVVGRYDGRYEQAAAHEVFEPDWVAGMFMAFKAEDYAACGGFDERFFLYYEDVDICSRLRIGGRRILGVTQAKVVHHAQRASWRQARHFRMHVKSVWRYFTADFRRVFPSILRRDIVNQRTGSISNANN